VSEFSSGQTNHDRSSANKAIPTTPTSLLDLQEEEEEEMALTSQPGLFNRIRNAKAAKKS